jgi:nucleotide-binding universal stress UspA family protein
MAEHVTADDQIRLVTSAAAAPARVVVGVDGTAANDSAVTWAAQEALRHRCPLVLLGAGSGDTPPSAPRTENLERGHIQRLTRDMLETVRYRLMHNDDLDVQLEVGIGEPSHALVRFADERDLVVVGKRSGHPLSRTVQGSTSIATVGRSLGPVVVVPEHWSVEEDEAAPVVLGLQEVSDDALVRVGLTRAADMSVDVVVVRSWEPTAFGRSPEDMIEHRSQEQEILESTLDAWRQEFPHVSIRGRSEPLVPAVALLDEASDARLLVLGRRTRASHPGGLSMRSTTRRVLHHAPCPVLVVPLVTETSWTEPMDERDLPEF